MGQSGPNSYHYHETGALSFSALIDLGGGGDWYSRGRSNNASIATGRLRDADAQNLSLHGLFIDR